MTFRYVCCMSDIFAVATISEAADIFHISILILQNTDIFFDDY